MKMRFILFFLLFFLLSVSNCKYELVQIPWSGTSMTKLNTYGTNYFYVTLSNSRTYGTFELYFEDLNFYLSTDLYFLVLDIVPTINVVLNSNFSQHGPYKDINDYYGTKQYHYSYNYKKKAMKPYI